MTQNQQQSGQQRISSWIWWLAWRQFSARRHGTGLSFMTVVSVMGVAIGVGAIVLVLSVMGGFEADLRRQMLSNEPHIEILAAQNAAAGFSLLDNPITEFKEAFPEVGRIEPFISADVVLKRGSSVAAASMIGVRQDLEGSKLWVFETAFVDGSFADMFKLSKPVVSQNPDAVVELPGLALGAQLANQIGADIGDEITILSPQSSSSAALSGGTLARRYVLRGVISTGHFAYDGKWIIMPIDEARYFMPDFDPSLIEQQYVTGVAFNVPNPMNMESYLEKSKKWADLAPKTWQTTNKSLLFALKLEKFTMGSILTLIILVAAFSISGTLIMTVFHKKGQVSILRSLGMTKREIAGLYLAHGFSIGTVGVLIGLSFGLAACLLIKNTHLFPLPDGYYYLKMLPVKFLPFEYVVICSLAWVFALVASTYPALAAAGQNPTDGVRCE
jgi:lipoprotein-releasing system permease protein